MATIGGREVEFKFTFNSFLYMEDLDLTVFEQFETKPLKMIPVTKMLVTGAANNDPQKFFNQKDITEYIESQIKEGKFSELFEHLVKLLQDSDFFKSLQMNEPTEG